MTRPSVSRRTAQTGRVLMVNTKLVAFKLDQDDDGWPPFRTESMHVEFVDEHSIRIGTPPFFIKDLAVGDVIKFVRNNDGEIYEFSHELKSDNSTIWIVSPGKLDVSNEIKALIKLGCSCEELEQVSLYSIHIPKDVNFDSVDLLLGKIEELGGFIAEPAFRH